MSNPDEDIPLSAMYLPDGSLNPDHTRGFAPTADDIAALLEAADDDSDTSSGRA